MDSDLFELIKNEDLIDLEQVFYSALSAGKLHIAQKIYQIEPNVMQNHNSVKTMFYLVCGRLCHLDVAQWLLQVSKERGKDINISFDDEDVFRGACQAGRLDIAQWLLQVKQDIDISVKKECAFHSACINGHLDVAKWLQSLKPDLYGIEYDENGKYIGYTIGGKKYDLL